VTENINHVDGSGQLMYMEAVIHVRSSNPSMYVPISNLLAEKFDHHVTISAPDFKHEAHTIEKAR